MDVPIVAWQQAAIVVLFALAFVVIIRYLMAWFSRQQNAWQDFISQRDREWREWMSSSNKTNCDALENITEALEKLAGKVDHNNKLLIEHDGKVHERVTAAARRRKPDTGPLAGKPE